MALILFFIRKLALLTPSTLTKRVAKYSQQPLWKLQIKTEPVNKPLTPNIAYLVWAYLLTEEIKI
jgi:hypothetical protein